MAAPEARPLVCTQPCVSGRSLVFQLQSQYPTLSVFLRSPRFLALMTMGAGILAQRAGVFQPRHFRLRSQGLDLLLEGKPVEAERCYRAALDIGDRVPEADRVRLLVCLGDALIDEGRYADAKQYLGQALDLGDPTGSGQGSMCDALLALKESPERAIEMADEAMRLQAQARSAQPFGARWAEVSNTLYEAKTWARKCQALLLLGRKEEALQAVNRALKILDSSEPELQTARPQSPFAGILIAGNRLRRMKQLAISSTYWRVGLSLLAVGDEAKATQELLVVCKTDRMGKYRNLAQGQLDSLGYRNTTAG